MKKRCSFSYLIVTITAATLCGCFGQEVADLQHWMDETRAQSTAVIKPIPVPKSFTPFQYTASSEIDPYSADKLRAVLVRLEANANNGLQPDLSRRKEATENFPLDTVTMVGTLERPGMSYALVKADATVYHVRVGNFVGQNFGKIVGISESAVEVVETVKDENGEWAQRPTRLELQESGN